MEGRRGIAHQMPPLKMGGRGVTSPKFMGWHKGPSPMPVEPISHNVGHTSGSRGVRSRRAAEGFAHQYSGGPLMEGHRGIAHQMPPLNTGEQPQI